MQIKTALIIPFHNRAQYLRLCLESLPKSDVKVILINDASTEPDVIPICEGYEVHNMQKNKGIKGVLKYGFEYCFANGFDRVINLDSDMIVTEDFFNRMLTLADQFPNDIISGFNSASNRNPVLLEHENYRVRRYANGPCLSVSRETYKKVIAHALAMPGNWDYNISKYAQSVIVSKPSLTQHIGVVSSMGHQGEDQEYAADFPKIQLPNVTLFGIDAHDPLGIIRAAKICIRHIDFGDVQIITERLFKGREGYSEFCIKHMAKYIKTSHVLIIHPDGYIQNPWAWNPEWLDYDLIGANWDWYNEHTCGNGGFTLRSKKLLDIISNIELKEYHPEDDVICRNLRPFLEKNHSIKFAPAEACKKFSIEGYGLKPQYNRYRGEFGFHSHNPIGLPIPPLAKKK